MYFVLVRVHKLVMNYIDDKLSSVEELTRRNRNNAIDGSVSLDGKKEIVDERGEIVDI